MKKEINRFDGKYFFLSNFYGSTIVYNGVKYLNNEAAFQAQKCPSRVEEFSNLPPNYAKALGRKVSLRNDWENVKDRIMYEIVFEKFIQNESLKNKLLQTGDAKLIEGNTWNDKYWGVCNGYGKNKLGNILEKVRTKLSE